jgi:predicted nucleotidyltransferase
MPPEPLAEEGRPGLLQLAEKLGLAWDNLTRVRSAAEAERQRLGERLGPARLVTGDTGFVVFGSLARGEWTTGSDVDWALLVDGPADDAHLTTTHEIRRVLQEGEYKDPGPQGLFGGLAFSHELIHRIGGNFDSNRNITQRILLLLESRSPIPGDLVRGRVLRALLSRYLSDDFGYPMPSRAAARVPRFLLNDIVRYWRTMAVDFAAKRRERAGRGWGLRNFKLRLSRKLIFAAGLAACLSCRLRPPARLATREAETEDDYTSVMAEHLLSFANSTPIDTIAWLALEFDAAPKVVRQLVDSYDSFLEIIDDPSRREHLDGLGPEESGKDALFVKTREIGNRFQEGLTALFFGTDEELTAVTQRYGVF